MVSAGVSQRSAVKKRTRLSPQAREAMILDEAVRFFAECGFRAQTRELAERIGIAQSLIYRYFPTKEVLLERVYRKTFEDRWNSQWEEMLTDRSIPLEERMIAVYRSYLEAIDDPVWIRIVMHSSLDGQGLTAKYISQYVGHLMDLVAQEVSAALGGQHIDPETVWHLQSTFVYYLVRKHIHETPVNTDAGAVVDGAVRLYLRGLGVL